MRVEEIESLVGAMRKADTLKPMNKWMCRGHRFVFRLQPGDGRWVYETWDVQRGQPCRWLELPTPAFAETELFDLLPALKDLCGQAAVSIEGNPYLADGKPERLSDAELANLLKSVAAVIFDKAAHLSSPSSPPAVVRSEAATAGSACRTLSKPAGDSCHGAT
jgi:hypothetical protein